jgi:hypothetical protein
MCQLYLHSFGQVSIEEFRNIAKAKDLSEKLVSPVYSLAKDKIAQQALLSKYFYEHSYSSFAYSMLLPFRWEELVPLHLANVRLIHCETLEGFKYTYTFDSTQHLIEFYTDLGLDEKETYVFTYDKKLPIAVQGTDIKFYVGDGYFIEDNKYSQQTRYSNLFYRLYNEQGDETQLLHIYRGLYDSRDIYIRDKRGSKVSTYLQNFHSPVEYIAYETSKIVGSEEFHIINSMSKGKPNLDIPIVKKPAQTFVVSKEDRTITIKELVSDKLVNQYTLVLNEHQNIAQIRKYEVDTITKQLQLVNQYTYQYSYY